MRAHFSLKATGTAVGMRFSVMCLTLFMGGLVWSHPGPGIAVDQKGNVYFVYGVRHRVMKVDAAGNLTTFAQGEDGGTLSVPHHLIMDAQENLYSVGDRDGVIWRIAPSGKMTRFYPSEDSHGATQVGSFGDPFTIDNQGNIYGVNSRPDQQSLIVRISRDGRMTTLAGSGLGMAEGPGARAQFGNLHSGCFAWGRDGSLYLTEGRAHVRKITSSGAVSTLADGEGRKLEFKGARGLACDAHGILYLADSLDRRIYKVQEAMAASVLAGTGRRGSNDGPARTATFQEPTGVAVSGDGSVYVLDYLRDDPSVRKISPDGMITTIATTAR